LRAESFAARRPLSTDRNPFGAPAGITGVPHDRTEVVAMRRTVVAGLACALAAVATVPANAHRTELSVEIVSVQATLAPDGRSITFDIETRCDRKATIVQARASASQPQASGEGSFTPTCNRLPTVVRVTVPALDGTFRTGDAQVSVVLAVQQGSTKQVRDTALLRVRPSVAVVLADRAVLEDGGRAARIAVSVTCPMTSTALGGQVTISQYPVGGTATFGPTPCDGVTRTLSVSVAASGGSFQPGSADAEAFAAVEEGGDTFPGGDLRTIQLVSG
jgi:hypothetical protein